MSPSRGEPVTSMSEAKTSMAADALALFADDRVESALRPVSDDLPAGESVRGDPDFDAIEEKIRRLESDGPSVVNWKELVGGGLGLLEARSKDLLVGVWVTYALFQTERLSGLATGLGILRGLVDRYWSDMQPVAARERARVAALEWLAGRAAPLVSAETLTEKLWPAVLAAYDDLTEIDRIAGEKLIKEQVALGELIRALRPLRDEAKRGLAEKAEAAAEAERQAAERGAVASAPAVPAAPAAPSAAASGQAANAQPAAPPVLSAGDPDVALAQLPDQLRQIAQSALAKNLLDPRAYALSRTASWLRIRQAPPSQGGRSGAAPPQTEIAAAEALRSAGQHRELVMLTEEAVWSVPFWFDGHRLAATALRAIGSEGAGAEAAITGLLAGHLRRFPELSGLAFADGTPFTSQATLDWLGAASAPAGVVVGDPDLANLLLIEARAALAAGKGTEGLDRLARASRSAASGRERLQTWIAQATFCLEVGLIAAAIPILDHAIDTIDRRDLETWEPDLACRVAELRFKALASSDATRLVPEDRRRAMIEDTRARLSRLDLTVAARLLK